MPGQNDGPEVILVSSDEDELDSIEPNDVDDYEDSGDLYVAEINQHHTDGLDEIAVLPEHTWTTENEWICPDADYNAQGGCELVIWGQTGSKWWIEKTMLQLWLRTPSSYVLCCFCWYHDDVGAMKVFLPNLWKAL